MRRALCKILRVLYSLNYLFLVLIIVSIVKLISHKSFSQKAPLIIDLFYLFAMTNDDDSVNITNNVMECDEVAVASSPSDTEADATTSDVMMKCNAKESFRSRRGRKKEVFEATMNKAKMNGEVMYFTAESITCGICKVVIKTRRPFYLYKWNGKEGHVYSANHQARCRNIQAENSNAKIEGKRGASIQTTMSSFLLLKKRPATNELPSRSVPPMSSNCCAGCLPSKWEGVYDSSSTLTSFLNTVLVYHKLHVSATYTIKWVGEGRLNLFANNCPHGEPAMHKVRGVNEGRRCLACMDLRQKRKFVGVTATELKKNTTVLC